MSKCTMQGGATADTRMVSYVLCQGGIVHLQHGARNPMVDVRRNPMDDVRREPPAEAEGGTCTHTAMRAVHQV